VGWVHVSQLIDMRSVKGPIYCRRGIEIV
jgi:hypothetical protein